MNVVIWVLPPRKKKGVISCTAVRSVCNWYSSAGRKISFRSDNDVCWIVAMNVEKGAFTRPSSALVAELPNPRPCPHKVGCDSYDISTH